jgi:hypothetical protein
MKSINLIVFIFISFSLFAHNEQAIMTDSLVIQQLQQSVEQLQSNLKNQKADFSKQLSVTNDSVANLQLEIDNQKTVMYKSININ